MISDLPTKAPLVSIVTPSFNQAAFIEATIESVLAQDYPQIEYLIVDGGSTDGTLDILRRYGGRVRWISEPDGGQADAINKGFRLTRGMVLAWLNADDVYALQAVSRAVRTLQAHPQAALLYGRAEFIDRAGRRIGPCTHVEPFDLQRLIHQIDFIVQPATFFRRESFMQVGELDTSLRYCLDYDLWIRLALRYPVHYLPEVLAHARIYPETKTASGGMERLDEIEHMIRRYGRRRLPALFYGEAVRTSWRTGLHALTLGKWGSAWSTCRRGAFYGVALALRKARYGR
jgi:glycosyltransferase involved in cell wall biosynthesis